MARVIIENPSGRRTLESPGNHRMRVELGGQQTSQETGKEANSIPGDSQGAGEPNVIKKCGRRQCG